MRRSLDPPELRFVCGNHIVDVKWQLDCHDRSTGTRVQDNQLPTFQDFVPFVPIYLGVKGKEWPRMLFCGG